MLAHQVGEKEHRALQHPDHDQVAAVVVAADLGARARRPGAAGPRSATRVSPIAGSLIAAVARSLDVHAAAGLSARRGGRRARRRRGRRRRGRASRCRCGAAPATCSAWRAAPGTGRPAARSASCWTTSRRSAGGSSARRSSSIVLRGAPSPSRRARRRRARRGPRPRRAAARRCAGRSAPRPGGPRRAPAAGRGGPGCARRRRLVVGRVVAPGQAPLLAVGGRLGPGEAEQRPDQPAVARPHPEQGAAARRGGEPVEDRLDLVVGGVAGGDQAPRALEREPRPPPRSGRRAPRPGGCPGPSGRRGLLDLELDPEPLAERRAVALVRVGVVAQAVVDVQRGDRLGARAAAPRGRAGRPSRGRRRASPPPAPRRAAGPPPRTASSIGRLHGDQVARSRGADTKSSVGSGKPLRLTSPIGSRSSPLAPRSPRRPRSVTSTSPARARLTTRWARLTWVPK